MTSHVTFVIVESITQELAGIRCFYDNIKCTQGAKCRSGPPSSMQQVVGALAERCCELLSPMQCTGGAHCHGWQGAAEIACGGRCAPKSAAL